MSFIRSAFAPQPLLTREQVMAIIIKVAIKLGMNVRDASIIVGMTISQEAGSDPHGKGYLEFWCPWNRKDPSSQNYPHDSESDDGRSVGYLQQQNGVPGDVVTGSDNWWGPMSSRMSVEGAVTQFLTRLKKTNYSARDAWTANGFCQQIQRSGVPDAYAKHFNAVVDLYNRVSSGVPVTMPDTSQTNLTPQPGFAGDPFWLADVLRAEGLNVVEVDGWQQRGEGDQGVLWGAVFHHTGNAGETPNGIAFHPTLGLAAHLLIRPDGTVFVCGIGKANHAGKGSWNGIQTDNANAVTIGVEVAILPQENAPHRSGWPDVQYFATVKTMAAILRKIARDSSHVISHKEWAQLGPAGWRQGKWDPGAIDMNIFRSDVAAQMNSKTVGEDMANVPQDQWDRVYKELTEARGSRSLYRDVGEAWGDNTNGFIRNIDAMTHQELVERLAIQYGDEDAIRRVWNVAQGKGADTSDWARDHAKLVLARMDKDTLTAWTDKNGAK